MEQRLVGMAQIANENLIISKQRVKDFGEVFTPSNIVKQMCDLVQEQCYEDDTSFFEPSCGTGNFLAEVLSRKLHNIAENGEDDDVAQARFYTALGSIYGVDIQEDNVEVCRGRLLDMFKTVANGAGISFSTHLVSVILASNIRHANALTDTVALAKVKVVNEKVRLSYYAFDLTTGVSRFIVDVELPVV